MTDYDEVSDNTPILVGAGQFVQRQANAMSPMQLAAEAAKSAIGDCGAAHIAGHIDTICVTKLFSDMGHLWPSPWGRSDNPPESVARQIGANPDHRIYTQTGGNEPQSRVIEFAADIAAGERSVVLLAGAEALKNQRHAQRKGETLDWNEHFEQALDDRGFGDHVATSQEMKNGLINVIYYYALVEQAQRHQMRRSVKEHREAMAEFFETFSDVASTNPYAQFPGKQTAQEILDAPNLTHLYTKRMIAQDGVNLGAALIMCSVGKAKELAIPPTQWVFMHGLAHGTELEMSYREDPANSLMAGLVAQEVLTMAGLNIDDIGLIDIYSCFPCAVATVAQQLNLPIDGSIKLTSTGGLPYFGGPGNNYTMHGIAEAVSWAKRERKGYALVTSNGGVLSKHASGVYSQRPCHTDWSQQTTVLSNETFERRSVIADPGCGSIVTYTVHFDADGTAHAIILGETESGERFVACTAPNDSTTPTKMLDSDPTGCRVTVTPPDDEKLFFQLAS